MNILGVHGFKGNYVDIFLVVLTVNVEKEYGSIDDSTKKC